MGEVMLLLSELQLKTDLSGLEKDVTLHYITLGAQNSVRICLCVFNLLSHQN